MNELKKLLSNLDRLDELNSKKFNSSDFALVNKNLEHIINEFSSYIDNHEIELKNIEYKNTFSEIISKIEYIEQKIIPKAKLVNSFTKSII